MVQVYWGSERIQVFALTDSEANGEKQPRKRPRGLHPFGFRKAHTISQHHFVTEVLTSDSGATAKP